MEPLFQEEGLCEFIQFSIVDPPRKAFFIASEKIFCVFVYILLTFLCYSMFFLLVQCK